MQSLVKDGSLGTSGCYKIGGLSEWLAFRIESVACVLLMDFWDCRDSNEAMPNDGDTRQNTARNPDSFEKEQKLENFHFLLSKLIVKLVMKL